jgi:hypothetical protein
MNSEATIPTGGASNVGIGYIYKTQKATNGDPLSITYTVVDSPPKSFKYFTVKLLFGDGSGKMVYLKITNVDS